MNDKVVNSSLVDKLEGRMWLRVPWSDVRVGDLVRGSSWSCEFTMLLEVAVRFIPYGILQTLGRDSVSNTLMGGNLECFLVLVLYF
jgi:hypothetical protein